MKKNALLNKKCKPCEGETTPLKRTQAKKFLKSISSWKLNSDGKVISKEFITKNFISAVNFIRSIAEIAEKENHHPNIHLVGYRNLKIELSTHAIRGLSENDFILAAKINELPVELKSREA